MSTLSHPKIVALSDLLEQLEPLRAQGKRIVFTNGCFDILHPGHVDLLSRARALGDVLVLGLNSDDSVRRLGKGGGRPFNSFPARAYVLAHLESIDFVVGFDEDTPLELISAIVPQVLVKGGDYTLDTIVGRDVVERAGGTVLAVPFLPGWSTTTLAERIAQAAVQTPGQGCSL